MAVTTLQEFLEENKPPRPPPRPHCGSCTHSVPPLPGHFSLSSCAKGHLTRDVMIYHNPCADFTPKTEAL